MNIQVRACVQSVHQQHAHMISEGHATGQSQPLVNHSVDDVLVITWFALGVFTGRRRHESLFPTRTAVQHP